MTAFFAMLRCWRRSAPRAAQASLRALLAPKPLLRVAFTACPRWFGCWRTRRGYAVGTTVLGIPTLREDKEWRYRTRMGWQLPHPHRLGAGGRGLPSARVRTGAFERGVCAPAAAGRAGGRAALSSGGAGRGPRLGARSGGQQQPLLTAHTPMHACFMFRVDSPHAHALIPTCPTGELQTPARAAEPRQGSASSGIHGLFNPHG